MSVLRKTVEIFQKTNKNIVIRTYSRSRYEEIEKLREGYGNAQAEENGLSKEIMDRIKNIRRQQPNYHEDTQDSGVYSSRKDDQSEKEPNNLKINGRKVSRDVPKDQVEIVSLKDY
ncbi:hypothetical protein RB653_002723 [Dictyostelium firmibasis]|uniref:Uncharacterized protein n=1 Tax=Dictyostelium firmibasis TaxID=79012 RepID=A0AAN7YYX4_9MYCE